MAEPATNETAAPATPTAPQPTATDDGKGGASQTRPGNKAKAAAPRVAAATVDELLAQEALATMKRTRTMPRPEPVRPKARTPIPAATLVVKKPQPRTWMAPFVTLAVIVAISSFISIGGVAFLVLRPIAINTASDTELRNLREAMSQLRRNVATLSSDVAANRAAFDTANRASSDRFGRLVQSVERVERDQSISATRVERMAEAKPPIARTVAAASSPEITGTIQPQPRPTSARREIIQGWRVRRAYEGVAIIEGPAGVIEVARGQDVPNLGRIEEIKNENGGWQVWTSKGVVPSAR
ncbi:hypothetical protein OZ411_18865 [Bradyrhizobium sp. Arg237L]|uniref:hypothetical protein n=1 Tax=Bradyrhizobium sp. Arg237L TaxID=3003352 RepID=UPI00249D9C18|nr:hypothetical protein [Bradyrhizobium sp. Arg237L]MDI4234870.1 hypothetical protein [Bradyrhizobium sp. Arg237L]